MAGLIGLAVAIHAPFHFGSHYGEQDAARLVNDALIWLKTGVRTVSLSEYRFYISPGYIWLAKQAVSLAKVTSVHPALYLNTINMCVAVLVVVPLFFLFRGLVGLESGVLSITFLSLIPTFWQSGLYGFPHLPALLFMVCALWAYDLYLTNQEEQRIRNLILMGLLLTISILLKADIYLSTVACLGLLIYRHRFSRKDLLLLGGVLSLPVILSGVLSQSLLANSPSTITYLTQWNSQYDLAAERLLSVDGVRGLMMSMGILSVPVFLVALVFWVMRKRYSLALLLALWATVPLAFWVFRAGDSSRHHFQASVPVALGIGTLLGNINWKPGWRYAALIGLILVNYFAFAPSSSTSRASGNLAQSSRMISERVAQYHRAAEAYTNVDADKRVILGGFTNAYAENEILWTAKSVDSVKRGDQLSYDATEIRYTINGKSHLASSLRVSPEELSAVARAYLLAGYRVFSMEYDLHSSQEQDIKVLNEF
jgi:Dolichyl-phosphate-mannose-protein mannosyltransferase